ncbi:hypothetical protein ACKLNR_008455 [Fusarium oxysporum f. sp. zingiberi]
MWTWATGAKPEVSLNRKRIGGRCRPWSVPIRSGLWADRWVLRGAIRQQYQARLGTIGSNKPPSRAPKATFTPSAFASANHVLLKESAPYCTE